jgi:imidazolonepropionase-like amidohydrolase
MATEKGRARTLLAYTASLSMRAHLTLLLAILPIRALAGQTPSDTSRYVILFSDRPAGFYREWASGSDLHSVYEYNDRGRGPHQETTLRVGTDDFPTAMSIQGHSYVKDTVAEQLTSDGDTYSWSNRFEHGSAPRSARAFYITAAETPTGLRQLVQAGLKSGGHLDLLPSGTATVERTGDITIQANGRSVHLIEYSIGGIAFSPNPVWLEDGGSRFAIVSPWFSLVPEGWEPSVARMVAVQEGAREARFFQLAANLAHHPTGPLVIRHAALFVAESALVRPNMTVVVTGNRISAVGPDDRVTVPARAQVIDATGKTLLPGLWDMHVHISPGEDGLLHVAAGVTSARDMGNDTVVTLALRRRFATDSLIGPRLMLSGLIDGSGPYQVPIGVLADDSAAARRAVEWFAAHGYEQIKIYSSMKPELVPGIIATAHAKGLRVSGHVPAFMRAEDVVRDGFNEVQHVNFLMLNFMDTVQDTRSMARFTAVARNGADLDFDSQRVRDFIALFKARGVDIDPTLVAFEDWFTARPGQLGPSEVAIADRMPPQVRRSFYQGGLPVPTGMDQRYRDSYGAMLHMVRAMYDAGVPIVAGTDASPVGFALFRELELYVQAGIPAPQVLQLATIGAARVMHHDDERGSIATGKLADLVLVDGDPTRRISDIRGTWLVVKNGLVYRPAELYAAVGVKP